MTNPGLLEQLARLLRRRGQVTCKTKHSLYERITHIGGIFDDKGEGFYFTEDEAIALIQKQSHSFYTNYGNIVAEVEVDYRQGRPYLKTNTDTTTFNNLLMLPSC